MQSRLSRLSSAQFAPQLLCPITPENATTLARNLAPSASEFSFAQLFLLDQGDAYHVSSYKNNGESVATDHCRYDVST
jgi:hypothetical protein